MNWRFWGFAWDGLAWKGLHGMIPDGINLDDL